MLTSSTGAAASEEVAWDEDSEDEPSTPQAKASDANLRKVDKPALDNDSLKPGEPRKSQDRTSQADSDASYDVVSGATSRAPGSPKEEKDKKKEDSEEEEDWE